MKGHPSKGGLSFSKCLPGQLPDVEKERQGRRLSVATVFVK